MSPIAVLAGGLATRLGGLAATTPKILIEVAGRPFAEHQIRLLKSQGIRRIVYCVGHLADAVRSVLGDGRQWEMEFEYIEDGPAPAGTGGAIQRALPRLGETFFTMYGDAYLDCDLAAMERAFHQSGLPALMAVYRNDNRWDASNVAFEEGRILAYDKVTRTPRMHHIDYGCGVLTPGVFNRYPAGGPLDLATVHGDLVREGRLAGYEVHRRFYEIGSPAGLEETRAFLASTSIGRS